MMLLTEFDAPPSPPTKLSPRETFHKGWKISRKHEQYFRTRARRWSRWLYASLALILGSAVLGGLVHPALFGWGIVWLPIAYVNARGLQFCLDVRTREREWRRKYWRDFNDLRHLRIRP